MDADVGIGPLGDLPGSRGSPAELCSEVVSVAGRAEELGFASVWVGERHLMPETVTESAPFTLLSAVAAATDRIRLGTAVALAPLHHPIRLVERAATVDAVSGGRLTVGAGIGYVDEEFSAFGIDPRERVGHLLDAVEVFREAEAGEPFAFDGRVHEFDELRIEPSFTAEPGPPLWLGGTVPEAMERAARVGDGFVGVPYGPGFYRTVREVLEDACEDYGAFEKGVMVNAFVAGTTAEARETVRPGLEYLERRYARWGDREPRAVDPAEDPGAYGTPAEVAEALSTYREILGENVHLVVRLHYPDVPRSASDRALELLADEVL